MMILLDLPDHLLKAGILKFLTTDDLWRVGLVCRNLHDPNAECNVLQREFEEREALQQPQQWMYPLRQRVLAFERCRRFATEMTRQAEQHENLGVFCNDCHYPHLHWNIPYLVDGLRGGKKYLFFAQFACNNELLWQGFLADYISPTGSSHPAGDLAIDGEPDDADLGLLVRWGHDWIRKMNDDSTDVLIHLNASHVTNVTQDHVTAGLRVTLVSLVHHPQSLKLHYSAEGTQLRSRMWISRDDLPEIDMLDHQCERPHDEECLNFALPFLMWKSKHHLHSLSLLYVMDELARSKNAENAAL
ncbi:hypothetical protein FisN_12Lh080 [Fistulifera solaris]|uniref:F-box domain-containing protein n=1 Tax=Fistulifera solaris TaxID=1519565 RepID=A0A1Z5JMI7_FISSO|nr:hypothetical protein FisN_12Lh080 [Fistulifera solaris]|eukprot:GAX15215.1 hypothetical protein FisN_12Lh080 [Fistulifera solaris]